MQLTTFEWKGQTRYCCPDCEFDGPSEVEVLKHWKGSHEQRNQVPLTATLFDSKGQALTFRERNENDSEEDSWLRGEDEQEYDDSL